MTHRDEHLEGEHAVERVALPTPPGAWDPVRNAVRGALRPIEHFLHVEASGGILLMGAASIALVWASSPWSDDYEHLLETPVVLRVGGVGIEADLRFVVNELLMTLFFFVVGLEIKREIVHGELSHPRRAALPIAAAIGGMTVPALIYVALNPHVPARSGWGVPMATDIAFAVGVLTLLGRRVPPALRVLLLTLAIADDVGAVIVIALFYSNGIALGGLLLVVLAVLLTLVLQKAGVRRAWLYVLPGILAWEGMHSAGVHPTLAGVMLGLMTPTSAWLGPHGAIHLTRHAVTRLSSVVGTGEAHPTQLLGPLRDLELARREAISPVERLAAKLHPWVAWGIMPLFALANAGVPLDPSSFDAEYAPVMLGVVAGLVIGKPLGVLAGAGLVVGLRIAPLPRGVTWAGVGVVGLCAGIGFTMAIFVGDLAFDGPALVATKLAILAASMIAGVLAMVVGSVVLRDARAVPGAARTESEAEASTVA
ncbi:Na+/H+ antiporter NhaA [Sandaracinus amylolyticus]|uniref:Na(+)/H(+) antiporter NhaA n=1 Tax=Sandaracinus amylolyticus TaxID=927083 RepID=A0A0F6SDS7_9BACT|nr:Na+/H+ antiporter NhaA [Sandaracinus amylolyticus]AKF03964.1 Na+/H+ antiporter NhaA type [Sandaracinus amylolyticus]